LLEAPKETGNELLNKINWKICEIKMQQIAKLRCGKKWCMLAASTISDFGNSLEELKDVWSALSSYEHFYCCV